MRLKATGEEVEIVEWVMESATYSGFYRVRLPSGQIVGRAKYELEDEKPAKRASTNQGRLDSK